MYKYHINVFYSEEDECYVADIPDLQYCSAFGDTPEEAMKEIMIAQELWLQTALDTNKEIPKAKYRPIIYQFDRRASV
ncbi:MAG: type II toxin-antitoxin system HicB family antitoxin [Oscillospiraceae bacterium]|nr:type II toxin-antitoxin system HicB family antitoxin [Oscillospiraceae bacterium]